jgi:acetyltransferase-like isoleucine patch superfamily enzyme
MLSKKVKASIKEQIGRYVREFYLRFPPFKHQLFPGPRMLNEREDLAGDDIGDWSWGHVEVSNRGPGCSLKIGKFSSFAYTCNILLGGEHRIDWVTTYRFPAYASFRDKVPPGLREQCTVHNGDVVIGSDVWVGHDVIILSGVTVGDGAVIGAGSVVRKNVPAYGLAAGNPAIVSGYRIDKALIPAMLEIAWWDWPLEKIERALPDLCSEDIAGFVEKYRPRTTTDAESQ